MPALWRYLIFQFLKIALFCVVAFVAVLMTMRMDEIAHFAALGAPLSSVLIFTSYQIPYILPIAIPISCLIASFILMHRLSSTHELTAMRACGFAMRNILTPILFAAACLSLFNFWIVSEVATQSHFATNFLKNELRSVNPLLLLNNKHLMRLKGLYFDAWGPSRVGEYASDVILALPNKHQERLGLLVAQRLKASPGVFVGQGVTWITSMESKDSPQQFDHLFIENMEESITSVNDFAHLLQKKVWSINSDYLKLSFLLIRIQDQQIALGEAKSKGLPHDQIKALKLQLNRSYSDIARRMAIATATFTFTLIGLAFGIQISRRQKNLRLYMTIGLTVFYLLAFFVAKGADQNLPLAVALYMSPHLLFICCSSVVLRKISRGVE